MSLIYHVALSFKPHSYIAPCSVGNGNGKAGGGGGGGGGGGAGPLGPYLALMVDTVQLDYGYD